jgi:hypothetical protein
LPVNIRGFDSKTVQGGETGILREFRPEIRRGFRSRILRYFATPGFRTGNRTEFLEGIRSLIAPNLNLRYHTL